MATSQRTVDFLLGQMAGAGDVSARRMFGEVGLSCDGRSVALVCNEQLFIKQTAGGRAMIEAPVEAPPYPGAKPAFLIDAERWDDGEWLARLIATTARELPAPKPKKPRSKKPLAP